MTLSSCKRNNDVTDPTDGWTGGYGEQMVYHGELGVWMPDSVDLGGTAYKKGMLYLCDKEVKDVLVSDAAVRADYSPWRLPTRLEAAVLKTLSVENGSQRYLCVDEDNGVYYTFKFGGGSVTKAGEKTKYAIRPVRTVYNNDSIIIYL